MFIKNRILMTELNDRESFPGFLKTPYMECLGFVQNSGGFFKHLQRSLSKLQSELPYTVVQDFGSGSGVHIQTTLKSWPKGSKSPSFVLSDLNPQLQALKPLESQWPNLRVSEGSVDMTQASLEKNAVATLVSCFHHLSETQAKQAIANFSQKEAQAVVILEPFERSYFYLLKHLLLFLPSVALGLLTPLVSKNKLSAFVWCTLIPIAPLCVQIDCILSVLRSFTYSEIKSLLEKEGFEVRIESYCVVGLRKRPQKLNSA